MPAITKIEHEKRLRAVQEWIIEDYPSCDIVRQCVQKWGVSERQAKRYVRDARETWVEDSKQALESKRATRIQSLKKLKRDLDPKYRTTPQGIKTLLAIDKEIIKIEGTTPTKQMIEAANAEAAGQTTDPLSPTTSTLKIEAIFPHADTKTGTTPTASA